MIELYDSFTEAVVYFIQMFIDLVGNVFSNKLIVWFVLLPIVAGVFYLIVDFLFDVSDLFQNSSGKQGRGYSSIKQGYLNNNFVGYRKGDLDYYASHLGKSIYKKRVDLAKTLEENERINAEVEEEQERLAFRRKMQELEEENKRLRDEREQVNKYKRIQTVYDAENDEIVSIYRNSDGSPVLLGKNKNKNNKIDRLQSKPTYNIAEIEKKAMYNDDYDV